MADPQPLTAQTLHEQLGAAYARHSAEAGRHLELLRRLQRPNDVEVDARSAAGGRWALTVCAVDQVGALSLIAGLLAGHGVNIDEGDVFTIGLPPEATSSAGAPSAGTAAARRRGGMGAHPLRRSVRASEPARPRRLILDVFLLTLREGGDASLFEAFRAELVELQTLTASGRAIEAHERVIERVASRARAARAADGVPALAPVRVEVDNGANARATRVVIRSSDTPGFLFEFTSALATLEANIVGAEIRTVEGETRDSFWVTDSSGRRIEDAGRLEELRLAAVLIKQFARLLPAAPDPALALRQFGTLTRSLLARPERSGSLGDLGSERVLQTLAELLGVSRFLWEDFLRMQHESLFPLLSDAPALDERKARSRLVDEALEAIRGLEGSEAVHALNAFKDREMFRVDLRHITRRVGFLEFSRSLSDLAEAVVVAAAALAERSLAAGRGEPRLEDGQPCGWVIFALGKFGGRDLGFASDIELLFVYEGAGSTDGRERASNERYFDEFVRAVRDSIVARQEGIFELDMRLRPYGAKGALAVSAEAFERYYSEAGDAQQFERLAMVRLRPVAGDEALARRLIEARDAWVYAPRPIDLDDIRHLRGRQAAELIPPGVTNAKYSPGGVVDLEYFTQAMQIEAGARDASVRVPGTLEAAELLAQGGHMHELLAGKLQEAYGFMRRLIDALRVVRGNAKDLAIPEPDSRAFSYLARRLHFERPDDLARAIEVRMAFGRSLLEEFARLRPSEPRPRPR